MAGFVTPLPGKDAANKILPERESLNWEKIKQHAKDFMFINSVNDPWGCDDKQGRMMFDNLGGTLIINKEGHILLKLID